MGACGHTTGHPAWGAAQDMTTPTQVRGIEIIQNVVLDMMQPLIQRISDLEKTLTDVLSKPMPDETQELDSRTAQLVAEVAQGPLEARLEAVIALHTLDAVPLLYTLLNGKQEQAPDGMWEITCRVCKDHKLTWRQGDPDPRRCKTVELATR